MSEAIWMFWSSSAWLKAVPLLLKVVQLLLTQLQLRLKKLLLLSNSQRKLYAIA